VAALNAYVPMFVGLDAEIVRSSRRRVCPRCRKKRAVVAISLVATGQDRPASTTESACLECWGVREHSAAR